MFEDAFQGFRTHGNGLRTHGDICYQTLRLASVLSRTIRNTTINLYVVYEIDEQEAAHALSLSNYHKEGTGDADYCSYYHRMFVVSGAREHGETRFGFCLFAIE